ncbi:MAG: 3D domain-containing protein [Thermoleophilia bacterium]|nr:3D domain-containing protein [Gaiellaceae bacterium]MDW8337564.1 3D domain-containing protein [Thermoleophilia bacterium]
MVRRGARGWAAPLAVVAAIVTLGSGAAGEARAEHDSSRPGMKLRVDAVAYHLEGWTALGIRTRKGVVAVDPTVITLGSRLFVPGYGHGIAADVGTAIRGRIIDLWMPSHAAARRWGRRTVTITVYR